MSLDNLFNYEVETDTDIVEDEKETTIEEVVVDEKPSKNDQVVVYVLRDLSKPGATKLTQGYNVISKGQYNKWKDSKAVRLASAEEIKLYLN